MQRPLFCLCLLFKRWTEDIYFVIKITPFLANNAYLGIDTTLANLSCTYDLPKRMGVNKLGMNLLTLSGNCTLGNVLVYDGMLLLFGNNTSTGATLLVVSGKAVASATSTFVGNTEVYVGSSSLTNQQF